MEQPAESTANMTRIDENGAFAIVLPSGLARSITMSSSMLADAAV